MSEQQTLHLSGDCGIRTVRALHAELSAALKTVDVVEINGADVERFDIACVQVIVSAQKTAYRAGRQLRFTDPSDAVRTAFARAGLPLPASNF